MLPINAEEYNLSDDEFFGIIYEISPDYNILQVGDYLISHVDTIWLDTGDGHPIQLSKRNALKEGLLVAITLLTREEDGSWSAEKLTVLKEKALAKAIKKLPASIKDELSVASQTNKNKISKQHSSKKPYMVDGVWKN